MKNIKISLKMISIIILTDIFFSIIFFVTFFLSGCRSDQIPLIIVSLVSEILIFCFYVYITRYFKEVTPVTIIDLFVLLTVIGIALLFINDFVVTHRYSEILDIIPLYSISNILQLICSTFDFIFGELLHTSKEKAIVTNIVLIFMENILRCLIFTKAINRNNKITQEPKVRI